jgi:hypothetical protein
MSGIATNSGFWRIVVSLLISAKNRDFETIFGAVCDQFLLPKVITCL